MRTLHGYLTRQVLQTLCMTVAVFTFVLLLGNVLKEVLALLVSRQVTLWLVMKAVGLLVPYVMAYVLPFGMLTAALLTFGRFSADQELTAVRAGGISLVALITPVLLLSLALCTLCAAFNLWIAPECRRAYKDLIFQVGAQSADTLITEDRFINEIPGINLYFRKRRGNELEDFHLYTLKDDRMVSSMEANRAEIMLDRATHRLWFKLYDPIVHVRNEPPPKYPPDFIGPPLPAPASEWRVATLGVYESDPKDLTELMHEERKPKLSEMNYHELEREKARLEQQGISSLPVRAQENRQISFSFACFGFTLVGIPLAIRAHRRETSAGVAIALILVLIYYTFLIMGDAWAAKPKLHPQIIVWIPNFLFQGLGALLLWRANGKA